MLKFLLWNVGVLILLVPEKATIADDLAFFVVTKHPEDVKVYETGTGRVLPAR